MKTNVMNTRINHARCLEWRHPETYFGRFIAIWLILFILNNLSICRIAGAQELTASWYSRASCLREGTSGIMANGKELRNENYTAASWFYRFGTVLVVTNLCNGKKIKVTVTDRGPNRKFVKKGRVIDLSMAAFAELAPLSTGVIKVRVDRI